MDTQKYITVHRLCELYHAELSFFEELHEIGLIEIVSEKNTKYLPQDNLYEVERIIRLHKELNVNPEGIDVVMNLLEKVEHLQNELYRIQSRLRIYEDER